MKNHKNMNSNTIAPLKIALLLPCINFGGAERVSLTLAKSLISYGMKVDLLLMSCQGEFLSEAQAAMNVIDLKADRTYKLPGALSSYITEARPDIIISSFWKLNLCACLVKLRHPKVKMLLWEHSLLKQSTKFSTFLFSVTATIFYQFSDGVVAVSNAVRESILDYTVGLKKKVIVISNPIQPPDNHILNKIARRNITRHNMRNIIWIGRLSYPKNPFLMLEAFSRLQNNRKLILTYVGEGKYRKDLENMVLDMGLQDNVKFVGFQPSPYEYLAESDLLVLSSDYEGFGNVLIEAMFCGLRVVSTNCSPSINEILDSGRLGTIAQVGDCASLAAAIETELQKNAEPALQIEGAMRYHPDKISRLFLNAAK